MTPPKVPEVLVTTVAGLDDSAWSVQEGQLLVWDRDRISWRSAGRGTVDRALDEIEVQDYSVGEEAFTRCLVDLQSALCGED